MRVDPCEDDKRSFLQETGSPSCKDDICTMLHRNDPRGHDKKRLDMAEIMAVIGKAGVQG